MWVGRRGYPLTGRFERETSRGEDVDVGSDFSLFQLS